MAEWWSSLGITGQVFACVAIPSTLLLAIQTVMLFFGLGDDGAGDIPDSPDAADLPDIPDDASVDFENADGVDVHVSDGLHLVSARSIVAFLCIFGWLGLTLSANGTAEWLSVIVALIGGFLAMLGVAYLVKGLSKLQSDGSMNLKYALGVSGNIYITVPPRRSGKGKVNIIVQGKLEELDAVTDEELPLPFGTEIVVIGLSGGNTLVVRRK